MTTDAAPGGLITGPGSAGTGSGARGSGGPGSGARGGWIALVAAAGCWGSIAVTTKLAEAAFGPATLLLVELSVAALALVIAAAVTGVRLPRPTPALLALGLLEPGLAYLTFNLGVERTSGVHAAVLIGCEPVAVVALGAVVLRDRPSRRALLGTGLSVVGVVLLASGSSSGSTPTGDLLVVADTLAGAGYVVLASRLASSIPPLALTAVQFLVGLVLVAPVSLGLLLTGRERWPDHLTAGPLAAALCAGLVGSAAAFLLYAWALGRVSASLAGASLTLIPLIGGVLSAVGLSEVLGVRVLICAALVVGGLALFPAPGASR